MFSQPTINSVSNLFHAPGFALELAGASLIAFGVVCYLARVAWFSLSLARQIERDTLRSYGTLSSESDYPEPYCAG